MKEKEYPQSNSGVPKAMEPAAEYGSQKLYTYADYRTWADDKRRELIDGIIYDLLSAPMRMHQRISKNILFFLEYFIRRRKGKCEVYHAPFDVRLPRNGETADNEIYTVVQPDICVVCDPSKLDERG
ncbi:MAG: Uma2 family endonuclease, partial [Bacteroidales bacterium]|nr:Uma2 family endonuclease [Bacteroidales bacterium]